MAHTNRPGDRAVVDPVTTSTTTVIDYHDRVRWGPIIAGIVVALTTQLVLSALGAAIGFSTLANANSPLNDAGEVGVGVGIWTIISLLISLFIGSWVCTSSSGPMNSKSALLNGAILWAATIILGTWLVTTGVTGAFGIVASNAGAVVNQVQEPGGVAVPPNLQNVDPSQLSPEQLQAIAANSAKAGWSFLIAALLGLAAALIGASAGARKPRDVYSG